MAPEHVERIGRAWAVFFWCLNKTTREENGVGYVCSETEVTADMIRADTGGSARSIYRHLQRLEMYGYLNLERGSKGFYITILKSKRWKKSSKSDRTEVSSQPEMTGQKCPVDPEHDRTEVSSQPEMTGQKCPVDPEHDWTEVSSHSYLHERASNQESKATMNQNPVRTQERETLTMSDGSGGGPVSLSPTPPLPNLKDDTPLSRWLKCYHEHRPAGGHPLARLGPSEVQESILRVEDLIETCGEDEAIELLDAIFQARPHPVSVKQAVYFCQTVLGSEKPKGEDNAKPKLWSQGIVKYDPEEATKSTQI